MFGDTEQIKDKAAIPVRCWKIIVVLPEGGINSKSITKDTRTLTVDMLNDETVGVGWRTYLKTVDAIEQVTDYDFLSKVPKKIRAVIEAGKDDGK